MRELRVGKDRDREGQNRDGIEPNGPRADKIRAKTIVPRRQSEKNIEPRRIRADNARSRQDIDETRHRSDKTQPLQTNR